ncbi:HET-domain-containing protein [Xylariaceae sp. FL1272]|nr:HET-domain-containing protein [Xylariaceae sp. FL1272]
MPHTYRDLIKVIAPKFNLANITRIPPNLPCTFCAKLVPDRHRTKDNVIWTEYEAVDTFPDFPILDESSRAGCSLCGLIRDTIRSSWGVTLRPMEEEGIGTLSDTAGVWDELLEMNWDHRVRIHHARFILQKHLSVGSEDGNESAEFVQWLILRFGPETLPDEADGRSPLRALYQELQFQVFDSVDEIKDAEAGTMGVPSRAIPDTEALTDRNINLIKTWIRECNTKHPECRSSSSESWLPTRLLCISGSPQENNLAIKLVETQPENSKDLTFLALSHMWGDTSKLPPLRTLTFNYERLKQGISNWDFPQNFWDAIKICVILGVEYLWIDSLCIIQDSDEDWTKEAGTMHLVYKHAEATIVAAASISTRGGFLKRNTRMTPAAKISYKLPASQDPSSPQTLTIYPYPEETEDLFTYQSTPWHTRGWTFQERFLSSRLLYFCTNTLSFECRHLHATEEGEARLLPPTQSLWPRGVDLPEEEWFRLWRDAVQKYTKRNLSFAKDKLIAIQSIANEMLNANAGSLGRYIKWAGLWEKDIKKQLLWRPFGGLASPIRNTPRAPSWSWAALECGISFPTSAPGEERWYGEEMKYQGYVDDLPQTGPYLMIQAHIRWIDSMVEIPRDNLWDDAEFGTFPFVLHGFAGSDHDGGTEDKQKAQSPGFARARLDIETAEHVNDVISSTGTQGCVYLHVANNSEPTGLVLRRSFKFPKGKESGSLNGKWERVGCATVFRDLGKSRIVDEPFGVGDDEPMQVVDFF